MRTVNEIMEYVEKYRTSGGRAEHFARQAELRAILEEELGSMNAIADVWHAGSDSFYQARLLKHLSEAEVVRSIV